MHDLRFETRPARKLARRGWAGRPSSLTEPIGSVRRLVLDLPEAIPITEGELRAIEILLGNSLNDLLASTSKASLKRRSGR